MSILFAELESSHQKLFPLTYTRPIADLRVGILTISEKWSRSLDDSVLGYRTQDYLQGKFRSIDADEQTIWVINGLLPSADLLSAIAQLDSGQALYSEEKVLIARGKENPLEGTGYKKINYTNSYDTIERTWDIFPANGAQIRQDFELLTSGREGIPIKDPHTKTYGDQIFLEAGCSVKAAILNAENGPIYLGKNSTVQEGAIIRGPFAVGEGSIVAMGAKMRGDTSAGPFCKLGGEISNSIFQGYSNKGHDGFLGNSVIGEWCNFGAGTNNSNLKNNYDPVRMWDFETNSFIHSGLQFCGLIMGDHSKAAINTMFNTGTTVGVSCNIYGAGFPKNMIPSFSWGGVETEAVTHKPRKAFITADIAMNRRKITLTEEDKAILKYIFEDSAQYRVWEK